MTSNLSGHGDDTVRVTVIVNDSRGFRHYYEELETTPAAVRDAFDLMARAASPNPARDARTGSGHSQLQVDPISATHL